MLIIISGPSGSGKTPLTYRIIETYPNIKRIQSYTTRKVRTREVDGTYVYMSTEEFEKKIKEGFFLEYNKVHKDQEYYGTGLDSYKNVMEEGNIAIKDIDVDSYKSIREKDKGNIYDIVGIYVTVKDREVLFNRLRERGESEQTINIRLHDRVDYENAQAKYYDYIVYTDDFDKAVKKVEKILDKELKKRKIKVEKSKEPPKITHMF